MVFLISSLGYLILEILDILPLSPLSDGSKGSKKASGADKENEKGKAGQAKEGTGVGREPPRKLLEFCERFMEFLIDLLCQLPTR